MEKFRKDILTKYENNKQTIWLIIFSVFAIGFIAHGFMYSNIAISHDSLKEFNAEVYGNNMRLQYGKFIVPFYRYFTRGVVAIPWIIGILALIYIAISVLLVVKMFNINSKSLIVILSGIFTTNMTVILTTATYIHDLDCDMLALLLAVLGAYLWRKYDRGYLIGIIPCMLSMGLYQSYISVSITLIMFYCIISLLNNTDYKKVFKKGFNAIIMLVAAGVLYAAVLKIVLLFTNTHLTSGSPSSLDIMIGKSFGEIVRGVIKAYFMVPYKLVFTECIYPQWLNILIIISLIMIAGIFILTMLHKLKPQAKALTLFLILILPFGMDFVGVLTLGNVHDLMLYQIWLSYLFPLLIVYLYFNQKDFNPKVEKLKVVTTILVSLYLVCNVFTANGIYVKKKLEYDATASYMNRVVYSIESYEGYKPSKTKVAFVGNPDEAISKIKGFEKYYNLLGCDSPFSIWEANSKRVDAYFDYVLLNDMAIADEGTFDRMNNSEEAAAMPNYPQEGSIKYIDDILVVKLGEPLETN